jgi:hypothetical protein
MSVPIGTVTSELRFSPNRHLDNTGAVLNMHAMSWSNVPS